MDKIAAILAIIDPTALDQPAVAKAAILAAGLGARVELLACETEQSRAQRVAPPLEELALPLRARGVEVATHEICGDPLHEKLLEWIAGADVDLVVKDTHHHSLASRLAITNTDRHLIRACKVPLLLAKREPWASSPVLVAAVDPGHAQDRTAALDRRILDYGACLASRLDGTLHVAHAYFPASIATGAAGGMPPIVDVSVEGLRAENARRSGEIAAFSGKYGVSGDRLHVDAAVAAEYLPRIARECRADLVVMGAISRSGLKRMFIGSTAERVLESLPCDALIVKPKDFAAALPF